MATVLLAKMATVAITANAMVAVTADARVDLEHAKTVPRGRRNRSESTVLNHHFSISPMCRI